MAYQTDCVFLLCDADATSGMGHFLRCAALAKALQRRGRDVVFIGSYHQTARQFAAAFQLVLQHTQLSICQRAATLAPGSQVVVDSYHYQPSELPEHHHYVVLDDFCLHESYPVAGVLNFTLAAPRFDYRSKGARSQALGLSYYLPHPSFPGSGPLQKSMPPHKVLLLIGSGDCYDIAPKLVAALHQLDATLKIRILGLRHQGDGVCPNVEWLPASSDIYQHYVWADFCITSGGLAKYECAYLGCPAAVISLTAGELQETMQFSQAGLCFNLGHASELKPDKLLTELADIVYSETMHADARKACNQVFSSGSAERAAKFVVQCLGECTDATE
ncbi:MULTISPECIES: hypothetical protein [Alkalimonas]|uniref:UDP-2,4-diacetamido-2,4, 6-trideoxy-beta-L-altropyranose hydrolase n=2 Tax=Alkalimonas TaxID=265980 RepID=A0ABU7J4J8_9GAMM|nr:MULTISPECIES: hypothetical protein [unclassified Alkalimonas]MEE2001200.1 hypothetical protein [Alkalimonas sp. MEB108]MEE2025819.1 hypothetical protein [Alkalimonas sp. MEB004]